MLRRFWSLLMAALLIVSIIPQQAAAANRGADDNTPQTHPNTYANTGNQRNDIIGVALTQVGYLEGADNNTKYGAALNINHLGWCGAFVSWCAIQANIPNSVLTKTGVANPASYGLQEKYYPNYIPQPGDLFFTKGNTHVGLVYYIDGDYFVSIEGNTYSSGPEGVYIRRHKLSDMKYGSPNYLGSGNHKYAAGNEAEHPHKAYYRCTDCGSQYYTGQTSTRVDCAECKQATCSHSYGAWSKKDDTNHVHTCTKCEKVESKSHSWDNGKITSQGSCNGPGIKTYQCTACDATKTEKVSNTENHSYKDWQKIDENYHDRSCLKCHSTEKAAHTWNNGTITKPATCKTSGVRTYKCTGCGAEKTGVIPQTNTHSYTSWSKKNDTEHIRTCTGCGVEEVKKHSISRIWSTDGSSHWHECSDCHIKVDADKHVYGDSCDSPCTICKYKSDTGHHYVDGWVTDSESHWIRCESCDIQGNIDAHAFTSECDETCDTCGFVRKTNHDYGDSYKTDGTSHWLECSVCGKQEQLGSHISGEPEYEGAATFCDICHLQLTEAQDHEHFYYESFNDGVNHWGTCACGEVMETVPHTWSVKTGICSACGAEHITQEIVDDDLTPWIIGGAILIGVIFALIILIIVLSVKNKKHVKNSA